MSLWYFEKFTFHNEKQGRKDEGREGKRRIEEFILNFVNFSEGGFFVVVNTAAKHNCQLNVFISLLLKNQNIKRKMRENCHGSEFSFLAENLPSLGCFCCHLFWLFNLLILSSMGIRY